jgi:Ca2+-binding RTX toxin-like protein
MTCVVSEPTTGGAASVAFACVDDSDPEANEPPLDCTSDTTFRIDGDRMLREGIDGSVQITVTNTFRGTQPPPPPPPPPPPVEICNKVAVTVDLALGQSPTNGPDVIRGTPGDDVINGLAGDDIICALGGADIISGNQGHDRIFGGGGADEMRGNAGNDILRGRAGNDTLYGQAGNDTLDGGPDTDTCRGGTGTDTATACESIVGVP